MSCEQCPVCNGVGHVPNGFYTSDGYHGQWTSSDLTPETCRTCAGWGIVWSVAPQIIAEPPAIPQLPLCHSGDAKLPSFKQSVPCSKRSKCDIEAHEGCYGCLPSCYTK